MSENPLRAPRNALGRQSAALDDQIHCWPADYWSARYALLDGLAPRVERPFELEFPDLGRFAAPSGAKRLKVCIATEDFVGPVNNGGIGTTYTHLAYMLAGEGHDVTVAYLRGDHTENETIGHWVKHYAHAGIRFEPLPDGREHRFANAERWTRPSLMLLDYLLEERFDLVHVSEWRGSGLFAQLAKRYGLGLQDTTFAVKTSSPWLWNRDYGQEAVTNIPDIYKMVMERRSVELADMVIGGSAHLLRWMASQGYKLPAGQTHVQPNVVRLGDYRGDSPERGPHVVGGRIRELVFFGRLEARKGLEIFCEAVSLLDRDKLVDKVTFCGKPGMRLPSHPTLETPDYIREITADWNAEIEIHTDFDNPAVCSYLCRQPCIAVMPSQIENSSLAVYETTQYRIPFLASDVGGNAELIHPDDRDAVLFQPRPYPLYHKLLEVARNGLQRARPSFDNAGNLEIWKAFHHGMAQRAKAAAPASVEVPPVSALVQLRRTGFQALPLLRSLLEQDHAALELVLVHDQAEPVHPEVQAAIDQAAARGGVRLVDAGLFESDAVALRMAAAAASHDLLLLAYEGGRLDPSAVTTLARAATLGSLDLACGFVGECGESFASDRPKVRTIVTPLGPDVSYDLFDRSVLKPDLLITKKAFAALGGLTDEYKLGGGYQELLLSAKCHGLANDVVPKVVSLRRSLGEAESPQYAEVKRELWRSLRPYAESLPQALKPLIMGLAGIAPRFNDMVEQIAAVNRDRAQLMQDRDRWKARAEKAMEAARAGGVVASDAVAAPALMPGNGEEAHCRGGIFDVADGVVYGWARGSSAKPVVVEIVAGGSVVGEVVADLRLSPFLKLPPNVQRHGFVFDLGDVYKDAKSEFSIDVVIRSDRAPIARNMRIYPPAFTLEQALHEGFCENNNAGLIRGWVWKQDAPEDPLDVALYQNGQLWRVERADGFRRDLANARKGTGEYGFSVPIPANWRDDGIGTRIVDVRVAGSGLRLRRAPVRIEGANVVVSQ